jgi:aminodeoxyfutalosine deaminase
VWKVVKAFNASLTHLPVCETPGWGSKFTRGEHSGPESVADAVRFGRPNRLGHGLATFRDPALVDSIKSAGIHIEFCLTSNVCTEAISDLTLHPVPHALELGVSFSINTDDPGAFQCSVASEHQLLAAKFGFSADDFRTISYNSLAARFQPELRYFNSGVKPDNSLRIGSRT